MSGNLILTGDFNAYQQMKGFKNKDFRGNLNYFISFPMNLDVLNTGSTNRLIIL